MHDVIEPDLLVSSEDSKQKAAKETLTHAAKKLQSRLFFCQQSMTAYLRNTKRC